MLTLQSLIHEHELLDVMAGGLEACVASAVPDPVTAIRLKAQFSVALSTHLRNEDARLYPRLARSADPKVVGASKAFQSELATLASDWTAYLEEWSDDAVASDWETFRQHTRSMMARLRARMARENACLYPIALQDSVVRLKAA